MKAFFSLSVFLLPNLLFGQACKFERYYPYYPDVFGTTRAIVLKDGGLLMAVPAMDDTIDYEFFYPTLVLVRTDACGKTLWVNTIGNPGTGDDDLTLHELSDGNILVVGNTPSGIPGAINSISLAKHNGSTGALIKEEFVKGTPSSVSVGCVPNPYLQGSFIVFGKTNDYPSTGYKSRPLLVEIDEALTVKRWKQFQYSDFTTEVVTTGSIGGFYFKDAQSYYAFMNLGTSNSTFPFLLTLDTSFAILNQLPIPTDSIRYGLYSNSDPRWDSVNQEFVGHGGIDFNDPSEPDGDAFMRIGIDGSIKSFKVLTETTVKDCTPTYDGGYLAAVTRITSDDDYLQKFDKNLNTEWIKPTHGRLGTVLQTHDSSYVAAGVSLYRFWPKGIAQLYAVKTDPDGTFFYSGVNDEQEKTSSVVIYPNPSNGVFTFEAIDVEQTLATVWNVNGQMVFKEPLTNGSMNLSNQPDGLYVLQLTTSEGKLLSTQKISIVK
jgi:hypothetical protein